MTAPKIAVVVCCLGGGGGIMHHYVSINCQKPDASLQMHGVLDHLDIVCFTLPFQTLFKHLPATQLGPRSRKVAEVSTPKAVARAAGRSPSELCTPAALL